MQQQEYGNKPFRSIPIKLADFTADVPNKIQVIRCGKFNANGQDIEITPAILLSMKKNFESNIRKIDLAVDFAHKSDEEAAAWFKGLELSEDKQELWAVVEWTPDGKKALADKRYRYISADLNFNYQDNETKQQFGPTLLGAGLTNRPVIKGMEPVVQLSEGAPTMDPKDQQIQELQAKIAQLEKAAGGGGSGDGAGKGDDDEKMALKKQLADMTAKCQEYADKEKAAQADKAMAEKKSEFDKMLSEGRVVEAQREPFMKDDMKKFVELQKNLNLSERGHGNSDRKAGIETGDPKDGVMAETAKLSELAQKMVADDPEKKLQLHEAIQIVRKKNPELAKAHDSQFR